MKEKRDAEQMRNNQIAKDHTIGEEFKKYCPAVQITFKDVGMKLRTNDREILSGVTGHFPAGSLIALMGPSGGGKTTFMNALLGRASYAHVSGDITVNDIPGGFDKARNLMGFVPQDDILHCNLTVHQNLLYQALLRLPADVEGDGGCQQGCQMYCQECTGGVCCKAGGGLDKKSEHVEEVMRVLGIDQLRNDIVGTPESRGISGGQKKRVNIGMELAAMPSIIFMDEPTSGLDGAATLELAQCLSKLQKAGLTICCVIHQPRMSVFKSFSHLLLLGYGGKQVYCGRTEHLKDYLTELNFCMSPEENPADWMIDVVCGLESAKRFKSKEARDRALEAFSSGKDPQEYNEENSHELDGEFKCPEDLFKAWEKDYKAECTKPDGKWMMPKDGGKATPTADREVDALKARDVPGYCSQFATIFRRTFRQFDLKSFGFTAVGIYIAFYALHGLIPYPGYHYDGLYAKGGQGSLFALIMAAVSRRTFGDEQLIYYRECKTGISATAYWFAKTFVDFIAGLLYAFTYTTAIYYAAIPMQKYDHMDSMNFFIYWYWGGIAMLLSVAFKNQSIVTLILVLWPMLEDIYSGGIPAISGEIQDMSPFMYGWSSLSCNRWSRQLYFCAELSALPHHVIRFPKISEQLQNADICTAAEINKIPDDCDTEAKFGQAWFYLAILGSVWRILTWLLLALVKHANGHGFFRDVMFVISSTLYHWFECCGIPGFSHPEEHDISETPVEKPIKTPKSEDKAKLNVGLTALNEGQPSGSGTGADVEAGHAEFDTRSCGTVSRAC
jgi:ABC-type multidrug transport system ATPase subunit